MVLHDCHAEILAIRAFNYWLLTECHSLLAEKQADIPNAQSSIFLHRRKTEKEPSAGGPPFEIQSDVNLYMYCTCAPCGDGSMELCMASQEDATPWKMDDEPKQNPDTQEGSPLVDGPLHGRAHFSLLGVVRRKPARTDAESTWSKSCSDKLALKQVSSLLSWQTTHLVAPTENAYIRALILPEDEISRVACERSFGENGRMKDLKGRSWIGKTDHGIEYRFRPFEVMSVPAEEVNDLWTYAKPKSITPAPSSSEKSIANGEAPVTAKKSKPGNVSAVWTAAPSVSHTCSLLSDAGSKKMPSLRKSKTGLYETIIGGVKQGHKASSPSTKGASALSRAKLWSLVQNTIQLEGCIQDGHLVEKESTNTAPDKPTETEHIQAQPPPTYQEQKGNPCGSSSSSQVRRKAIQDARESLNGWAPNVGDESWSLDVLMEPKKRKR